MSDIEEKYNNCPKHIQEVVDLLLEWYADNDDNENDEDFEEDVCSCDIVGEKFLINSPDTDATDTRVLSYTFNGKNYSFDCNRKKNWPTFIEEIGNILTRKDADKMNELAAKKWTFLTYGKRPAITNYLTKEQKETKSKKHYRQLGKLNAYVCTNYDNNGKVQLLYALIKEFGYNDGDLTIEVEKLENSDSKNE